LINHEITSDTVKKSSSVGGDLLGMKVHPHKFRFAENLDKILEIPGKNGSQLCLTSKNGAQCLQKNT